jgi:hypothetical protein
LIALSSSSSSSSSQEVIGIRAASSSSAATKTMTTFYHQLAFQGLGKLYYAVRHEHFISSLRVFYSSSGCPLCCGSVIAHRRMPQWSDSNYGVANWL